jgi:DNA-binding MarR family transcriptional regulator
MPLSLAVTLPSAADVAAVLDALRRTVRGLRGAAQVSEKTLGVSGAQHFVLEELARAPAMSLTDLSARTLTHKSSLSVVVARLVDRGFVRRVPSRDDRRSAALYLTPAGSRALHRAPPSLQARLIAALGRLSAAEVAAFSVLFEKLNHELEFDLLEPTMLFEKDPPRVRGRRSDDATEEDQ